MMHSHKCLAGCGKAITWQFAICCECEKIYGTSALEWPEWLRFLWKSTQQERRRIRKQLEFEIDIDISDLAEADSSGDPLD